MANSTSPTPASGLFSSSLHNSARRRSPSPPLPSAPLSKRDKRRAVIDQRLKEIVTTFSRERDAHTRGQLNALSRDMQFISKVDVYGSKMLDDGPDDLIIAMSAMNGALAGAATAAEAETKVPLGETAAQFVNEVNDEMEMRDAAITDVDLKYRAELEALQLEYEFAVQVAEAEHQALKDMARQRVISSVQMKKRNIQREKDTLDNADSTYLMNTHALTALAAPGSPSGGPAGAAARKTRYSRLRADPGDATDGAEAGGSNNGGIGAGGAASSANNGATNASAKRKRRAQGDLDESPGPTSRTLFSALGGSLGGTALWEASTAFDTTNATAGGRAAKSRATNGFDVDHSNGSGNGSMPPASSLDRLFTPRELKQANAAAHTTVAQAWTDKRARRHLLARDGTLLGRAGPALGRGASSMGRAGQVLGAAGGEGTGVPSTQDPSSDSDDGPVDYSALAAPAMDRTGSHATRSTRLNVPPPDPPPAVTAEGLEELDDPRRIYGMATLEAQAVRVKATGLKDVEAPLTKELSRERITEDLAIVRSLVEGPE